jgi:ABC-type lipoprotein release transport system permease subunit
MASFGAVLRIVIQRSLGNWRLLATVVAGVILSSALMASVALYSDAIRDLGLKYALRQEDPLALDLRIFSSSQPFRRQEYALRRERTNDLIDRYAGDIVEDRLRYGRSATWFLTPSGTPLSEDQNRPRSHFQFQDELPDHVRVVEGRLPRTAEAPRDQRTPPTVEVAIGVESAQRLGVRVGQGFDLYSYWAPEQPPLKVTVTGLIEPNDIEEPYWFGKTDRFSITNTSWPTYPFWTDERTLVEAVAAYSPAMDGSFETFAYVGLDRIDSRNAPGVESRLRALSTTLREQVERTTLETRLPDTIGAYRQKLFFTRLPLFALIAQIVGIVLYYLVMVTTMLVERQSGEIALLKSRGASTWQIMTVYALEGLILAGIAVIVGPLLAAAAITLLGLTPPFHELSQGGLLEIHFSSWAFGLATLGALLSLAALLWPAYRAAGYSIVHYKQHLARPPQQPVFLRYYLDLALIAVGAFAFYQLRQRGSFVTERLFGDLSADPLLLITPTLFMLMIALVFLRLFPLALRGVAWLARGLDGAAVPLGLWHMVRSPLHYSRLILLLILATSVGMFAAGFRATLEQSYADRAAYEAGAPGRIEAVRTPTNVPTERFVAAIDRATDAAVVSPVARLTGSYSISLFNSEDLTLLAVDPETFGQVAFFRGDFAGESLSSLLGRLEAPRTREAPAAVEIPGTARSIGFWAQMPVSPQQATIGVRLQERNGTFWEYRMSPEGAPGADGWQLFTAALANPVGTAARGQGQQGPRGGDLRFDSIYVRTSGQPQVAERHALLIDDLQYQEQAGGWTVIEPFEDIDRYELITGASSQPETGTLSRAPVTGRNEQGATSNEYAARLVFVRQRGGLPLFGFRARGSGEDLPVLVSASFLEATDKQVGDQIQVYINRQYVPVRIAGSFEYFPTYDPSRATHLFVADLAAVQVAAARVPSLAEGAYPNEAWLAGLDRPLTKESVADGGVVSERVYDRSLLREQQASDPLIAASWEGILFLSFAAVLTLTALGFVVYSYLSAQTRALEFAILRTMGFSSRQILALVTFEQVFVIAAGVLAGTLLGFPLGRLMIGYMGITESGQEVLPPLISRVSWVTVATAYGVLALMFAATIAALVTLYSRLAVHRALRMGEL